jgi:hypothetical protein
MKIGPVIASAIVACGCSYEPPVSADLSPGEIKITASITSNGSLAYGTAILSAPDGSSMTLSDSDALILAADGVETTMAPNEGKHFGAISTEATDFSVIFERSGGSRVENPLSLPPAFALVAPPEPASRAAPLKVAWDADQGDYTSAIYVTSPCFTPYGRNLDGDPGEFLIQEADTGSGIAGECAVDVQITRSWSRDLSPDLAKGYPAHLSQVREVRFVTTP